MRRRTGVEKPLRILQAAAIEVPAGPRWLVEDLWAREGVGVLGGAPKLGKSWLAMDLAFSVATGTEALGKFPIPKPGPVLVFAAEDQPEMVRKRLDGLALHRRQRLESAPLHLILEHRLRLDTEEDQNRLGEAVGRYRPELLVLDPFVRLHRIDENSSLEVSGVLAFLRELQRQHRVAVLLVHHSRKASAGTDQVGLSLRGSGDLHAFGESYLYLRRRRGALELLVEQRNAPATDPLQLALRADQLTPPHLEVLCTASKDNGLAELKEQVLELLRTRPGPQTQESLRGELRVRTQRLAGALSDLTREGILERTHAGWQLGEPSGEEPFG